MMALRKSVLLVDKNLSQQDQITQELRERGLHTVPVEEAETAIPLLESKDRFFAIILIDESDSTESLMTEVKVLKQIGAGVPFIVSTMESNPEKEKAVRKAGVFYFHVMGDGMEDFVKAVTCAVDSAFKKDNFIPALVDR